MAKAPLADRLHHILEATRRIEAQTAGKSFDDYLADWVTRDVWSASSNAYAKPRVIYPML
jgi:hypothetical protein